jgi:putative RNA 2'-phosphotransferase
MESRDLTRTSKFLCFVLRHNPDAVGIALDPSGWAEVRDLIAGAAAAGYDLDTETIRHIVDSDDKRRYALSEDGIFIRANYGHSVPVDLGLQHGEPPGQLYHGTAGRNLEAIRAGGLQSGRRQFVHLSVDESTAVSVGRRHGTPVVLRVLALDMHAAGHRFYRSESGIWLTRYVPPGYIVFPDPRRA